MKTTSDSQTITLGYVPMGTGRVSPFDQVFNNAKQLDAENPKTFDGCDAIVVWGGEDISPSLYGEPVSSRTYAGSEPSYRDRFEAKAMAIAISKNIPIIGVCRGAQLACAMAGGKLIQDVENHGRTHALKTRDGRSITTSSVHHQMMFPWKVPHELIAWSSEQRSKYHIGGNNKDMEFPAIALSDDGSIIEPEIVFFPRIKALAVQGHPEFMDEDCEFVQYVNGLVKTYLLEGNPDE